MSSENEVRLSVRVDKELADAVRHYAHAYCDGNQSEALRDLITRGLSPERLGEAMDARMEQRIDEQVERIARVVSRGTKASLANLVLASTYLPCLARTSGNLLELLLEVGAGVNGTEVDDFRDSKANERRIADFEVDISGWDALDAPEVFEKAWASGGKIQPSEAKVDLRTATRGVVDTPWVHE